MKGQLHKCHLASPLEKPSWKISQKYQKKKVINLISYSKRVDGNYFKNGQKKNIFVPKINLLV